MINVIPDGVDVSSFRAADSRGRDLLFAGRLIERKGGHLLIRAFAQLVGDRPARGALERRLS